MKMSKLSNQTNSQDPQAVNSRVFVGNLNTFQCSKTDVERMFQKYGRLAGISMHKGYAFVQFTNPFDARNACHGEDGRTILSQILDVNMVAEPKPHQTGRKRQNLSKTGNDWDYYYDSYYASTLFTPTPPRPLKRQRIMGTQNRASPIPNKMISTNVIGPQQQIQQQSQQMQQNQLSQQSQIQQQHHIMLQTSSPISNGCNGMNGEHSFSYMINGNGLSGLNGNGNILISNGCTPASNSSTSSTKSLSSNQKQKQTGPHLLGPFKIYSNPDTLICGNCKECFTELSELLDHKQSYCKLRFICKCQNQQETTTAITGFNTNCNDGTQNSPNLLCVVCKDPFKNPWDLMVHAQAAHMINIYELGNNQNQNENTTNNSDSNGTENHHHNGVLEKENGSKEIGVNGIDLVNGDRMNENDIKEDHSSTHGSPYKDDHSVASNAHSSNENLFEEQLSSSPTPSNEDKHIPDEFISQDKLEDDACRTRECIMRTLSIDEIPPPENAVSSLSIVTNTLGLGITNGTNLQ